MQLKINSKFLMLVAALAILFADPMIFVENTFCDDSLTLENSDSFFEEPEEKTEENAQDDFFSDDLKMLDIQTQSDIETEADNLSPSPWRFSGSMETGAGYNFAHDRPHANQIDHRGLSSLYAGCDLNVE
ncbi:MAG: hypothetical protein GY857_00150, partial [Desulfobacula sp.]|nr:hypothetical protein [Desulfobacula sp.]